MPVVPRTTEIYADTRRTAVCSGPHCRKRILFAQIVKSKKIMPFSDPELPALETRHEEDTHRLIERVDLDSSHFIDCPDAKRF
jgi:hypothetical protein